MKFGFFCHREVVIRYESSFVTNMMKDNDDANRRVDLIEQ